MEYGTFTKNGETRTAYTPAEAVRLRFDGWQSDQQERTGPPSKSGRGSSVDAWRAYAARVGVEVAEDASRDAIIEALEQAGAPTE